MSIKFPVPSGNIVYLSASSAASDFWYFWQIDPVNGSEEPYKLILGLRLNQEPWGPGQMVFNYFQKPRDPLRILKLLE